jgi:ATP/maltotriose-dependent transcriptional regulator MalT
MAIGKVELGAVLLAQGEIAQARQVEDEALQIARETKLTPGEAYAEFNLGDIAIARGDLAAARTHHERSLALRLEMNETRTVLESRLALAELALEEGRPADAERGARQVDESLGTEPSGPLRVRLELLVARAHLARRAVESAAGALSTARRFAEDTERLDLKRKLAMVEAEYDVARGRPQEARARLAALRPVLQRAGMVLADLERRLFLIGLDRTEGLPTVKVDANALVRDAEARGAGLIARRVQALTRS